MDSHRLRKYNRIRRNAFEKLRGHLLRERLVADRDRNHVWITRRIVENVPVDVVYNAWCGLEIDLHHLHFFFANHRRIPTACLDSTTRSIYVEASRLIGRRSSELPHTTVAKMHIHPRWHSVVHVCWLVVADLPFAAPYSYSYWITSLGTSSLKEESLRGDRKSTRLNSSHSQ